ncbi:transducer protein Htr23 [Corynebacterium lizhenjunii]|uniref:Transducer protein Htr23 n=1 Tax=Corynebacterium lizhenjunii TaxID=2709394 RepID=A0A7T0KDS8_9CORY|nr:transducer protein Htr23 [Corynebacterium lizhenjunii]QPK78727.1 transducer protein Htr23 [Corynebacterium lizhenjunii]
MRTFEIDTDYTRALARDLDAQAQPQPHHLPVLPGGPLGDFCSALAAAFHNLTARDNQLRADFAYLADTAVATSNAAESADATSATACASLLGGS